VQTKKPITAIVRTEALIKLDEAVAKANEKNGKKFLNRSKVIEAAIIDERYKKFPPEELFHSKKKEMKPVCFSISEGGFTKLKDYKKAKKVTFSVVIDAIVRRESNRLIRVMEYCDYVIVGTMGTGKYLVSINKVNTLNELPLKTKKAIEQYSEVVHYKDECLVIMQYAILFKYLLDGMLNANA